MRFSYFRKRDIVLLRSGILRIIAFAPQFASVIGVAGEIGFAHCRRTVNKSMRFVKAFAHIRTRYLIPLSRTCSQGVTVIVLQGRTFAMQVRPNLITAEMVGVRDTANIRTLLPGIWVRRSAIRKVRRCRAVRHVGAMRATTDCICSNPFATDD